MKRPPPTAAEIRETIRTLDHLLSRGVSMPAELVNSAFRTRQELRRSLPEEAAVGENAVAHEEPTRESVVVFPASRWR